MFPLGTVLFPHTLLPLHIFEPRYRALARDCLAADLQFGVVLIERGSEVGGGDTRFDAGTVATIVEAHEIPDGRWFIVAEGGARFRVVRWLPDDPYPLAEIEEIGEAEAGDAAGLEPLRDRAVRLLQQVAALRSELGEHVGSIEVHVSEDPVRASHELVALAPVGPLDAQQLLVAPSAEARYRRLLDLLADEREILQERLSESPD
jgi:Lon protease-like protein